MKKLSLNCLLVAVVVGISGCKQLEQSLTFDERILVKVTAPPGDPKEVHVDGWHFKPIVAASATSESQPLPAEWYMVWKPHQTKADLRRKHGKQTAWEMVQRDTPEVANAAYKAFTNYPMVIEPNVIFGRKDMSTNPIPRVPPATPVLDYEPPEVFIGQGPSPVWPTDKNNPLWYLDDGHSQLLSARKIVEDATEGLDGKVRIGILDCGLDGSYAAMPERIIDETNGNAMGILDDVASTNLGTPGQIGTGHGTATITLLAGRKVKWKVNGQYETNYLGADPHATIVTGFISPWVISLETADMAYGIDYASRVKHCDVISMSNGGSPCLIWADAVNAAYERGTAIFTACGDFYSFVGTDLGFIVPSSTVYPAAFRRVVGVTGVTATGKTNAKNSLWNLVRHPGSIMDWLSRGSYGGDMQGQHFLGVGGLPDNAEIWDNGMLHAFPIAAYTPNTIWAASSVDTGKTNQIDLTGSGTSAATPQVAAAAALWLRMNYDAINKAHEWSMWKKAEAVYVALLASAQRRVPGKPDHYLGAGTLKAKDALHYSYADVCKLEDTRKDRTINEREHFDPPPLGFSAAPQDYFDGQRSIKQMMFPWRKQPEVAQRADLRQTAYDVSNRYEALKTIYFNGLLLEQFQAGNTPRKGRQEVQLNNKAKRLITKYDSLNQDPGNQRY
jgi:hypothetical protein